MRRFLRAALARPALLFSLQCVCVCVCVRACVRVQGLCVCLRLCVFLSLCVCVCVRVCLCVCVCVACRYGDVEDASASAYIEVQCRAPRVHPTDEPYCLIGFRV